MGKKTWVCRSSRVVCPEHISHSIERHVETILQANIMLDLSLHGYRQAERSYLTLDTDLAAARKLLGPDGIIGVTCSTPEEAIAAVNGGADYLGIGTMYATPT